MPVRALTPPVLKRHAAGDVVGCLLGGAVGDAFGGITERGQVCLSDDTQLTLATCESIEQQGGVDPAHLAATFRRWFEERRFRGLGSSTLKALRDLAVGAHWALAGARGERAAGNGGAMRIAPLAFVVDGASERQVIRDVVWITHHSDEAYLGALAVVLALQSTWPASPRELLLSVAASLPDSRVRDGLRAVGAAAETAGLKELAVRFGCGGYVVETVPLALVAGWRMAEGDFAQGLAELEDAGGDTDTIASIAGQFAGARLGGEGLPAPLLERLPERGLTLAAAERFRDAVRE